MTPVSIVSHMENMQEMLLDPATGAGAGEPAVLKLNHACETIDHETGRITFRNQTSAQHDSSSARMALEYAISPPPMSWVERISLTDQSTVWETLGIFPEKKQSTSTCYHCIIETSKVRKLGLADLCQSRDRILGSHQHRHGCLLLSPGQNPLFLLFSPTAPGTFAGSRPDCPPALPACERYQVLATFRPSAVSILAIRSDV